MPKQITSMESAWGRSIIGKYRHEPGVDGEGGHPGAADPEMFLVAQAARLDGGDRILGRGEQLAVPAPPWSRRGRR